MSFLADGRLSKKSWVTFVIYLCALSSPWLLDRLATVLDAQPYVLGDAWYRSFWKSDYQYQKITSFGARMSPHSVVSIVSFREKREPNEVFDEVHRCTARSFLAKLLIRVSEASPKAIVIHRWFGPTGPNECADGDNATKELTAAIRQVSNSIPIVIALNSVLSDDATAYCNTSVTIRPDTVILRERVHFEDGAPDVHYGLTVLNEENKKIPLGWHAYADCAEALSGNAAQRVPTLALEAVSVASHKSVDQVLDLDGLQAEYNEISHPFTHFRAAHFDDFSAMDILCGIKSTEDWRVCSSRQANHSALQSLRSQIVVVGDENDEAKDTVFGKLSGTVLQGYYLDSLWELWLLKPVPSLVQIAASLCLFLLVEMIFRWKASSPWIAFVFATISVALFIIVVVWIVIGHLHYYPNLVIPGFLALLGKLLQATLEQLYEKRRQAPEGALTI